MTEGFGRFEILSLLGKGNFAEVHRARMRGSHGFSKIVALKIINVTLTEENKRESEALINEARLGGRLKHSGIVDTYDFGEHEGRLYVAMEFIDGLTLFQVLRRLKEAGRKLPVGVVVEIAQRLASALSYAHEQVDEETGEPLAVVHRDLKPENIMLSRSGDVKIVDFGIAQHTASLYRTTMKDVAKGTPAYMSPEQVVGNNDLDGRADLFALGSVLAEMLVGESPFLAANVAATMFAILERDLSPVMAAIDETAPDLRPIVDRLLQRPRNGRPSNAKEVSAELTRLRLVYPQTMLLSEVMERVFNDDLEEFPESSEVPHYPNEDIDAYLAGLSTGNAEPAPWLGDPLDEDTPTVPDLPAISSEEPRESKRSWFLPLLAIILLVTGAATLLIVGIVLDRAPAPEPGPAAELERPIDEPDPALEANEPAEPDPVGANEPPPNPDPVARPDPRPQPVVTKPPPRSDPVVDDPKPEPPPEEQPAASEVPAQRFVRLNSKPWAVVLDDKGKELKPVTPLNANTPIGPDVRSIILRCPSMDNAEKRFNLSNEPNQNLGCWDFEKDGPC